MSSTESIAAQWERQVTTEQRNAAMARQGTHPAAVENSRQNVGTGDRIASLVGGAGLMLAGGYKGNLIGAGLTLIGAGLLYRGATGHCMCYEAMGVSTASPNQNSVIPAKQGVQVEKTIFVDRPVEEVYEVWRDLSNLPRAFKHLQSVEVQDGHNSHWVARGPAGIAVEWDAEVLNDHENRLIAWRSLPDSQVDTAGSVRFKPRGDHSTEVTVTLRYNPPGGKVADHVASWMGSDLQSLLNEDLATFKQTMESGHMGSRQMGSGHQLSGLS
jgi:uncharacterized membrane protein